MREVVTMANHSPTTLTSTGSAPSLREFGRGPKVPTRVRNVIESIPEKHGLVDLSLAEAIARWHEVEEYLLSLRSFGRRSCGQLRRAMQQELLHYPQLPTASGSPGSQATSDRSTSLVEHIVAASAVLPSIRRLLAELPPGDPIRRLELTQGLTHFSVVRAYLRDQPGVGSKRIRELHQHLTRSLDLLSTQDRPSHDGSEQTLGDFVRSGNASRRITNVFRRLPHPNPIDSLPLSHVQAHWDYVEEYLRAQRSFGAHSARELRLAVDVYAASGTNASTPSTVPSSSETLISSVASHPLAHGEASALLLLARSRATRKAVSELRLDSVGLLGLLDLPLPESSRMRKALLELRDRAATFLYRTLDWFRNAESGHLALTETGLTHLLDWAEGPEPGGASEWLSLYFLLHALGDDRSLSLFSVGESTPEALRQCIALSDLGFLSQSSNREGLKRSPALALVLRRFGTQPIRPLSSDEHVSIDSLYQALLAGLSDKHRGIVLARLAPAADDAATLKDIGEQFGLTRERIRQIVSRWSEAVQSDGLAALAARVVEREEIVWLTDIADCVATDASITTMQQAVFLIPHKVRVVLQAAGADPAEWLRAHAIIAGEDLKILHADDPRIAESDLFIRDLLGSGTVLPCLAPRIQGMPLHFPDSVRFTTAVREGLVTVVSTPAGPVVARTANARSVRLAFLASIFEDHPDWALSDQEIWQALCEQCPAQSRRSLWRGFSDSVRAAPERFHRLPRIGWIDLDDLNLSRDYSPRDRPFVTPRAMMGSRSEAMGDNNQRAQLYTLIAEQGAVQAKECVELWAQHDNQGTGTSAGYLLDDPFFVCAHPGYTACLNDDGSLANVERVYEALSNPACLETYLRLRYSGFGPCDFPAWDAEMLRRWVELVETDVHESVASSIICQLRDDIELIPLVVAGQTSLVHCGSEFSLAEDSRRPVDNTIPSAEDAFRILAATVRFGFTNWYLVNCCTSRQWFSHRSVSWLAFMIACGAVAPADHWQDQHVATPRAKDLLFDLLPAAQCGRTLSWSSHDACLRCLRHTSTDWQAAVDKSWVRPLEFSRLMHAMLDPSRRDGRPTLNPDVLQLVDARRTLPSKRGRCATQYIDPFLKQLLDDD